LPPVTVLATNLQIRDDKRTYGELDVIFSHERETYHWELAIKFYANTGNPLLEENWVGPLKKDNLKRKLDRLFDHQLQLCTTNPAIKALEIAGIDSTSIKSFPFVKGVLFKTDDATENLVPLPPRVFNDCHLQLWCTINDLLGQLPNGINRFCVLPKMRWMSKLLISDWTVLDGKNTLQFLYEKLEEKNIPQLIAFGRSGEDGVEEYSRVFLMPDNWESLPKL